jgi:hypothetical protein
MSSMADMDPDSSAVPPLHAIFDGARLFGLSDDEVWQTVDHSLHRVGGDATVAEYLDELTGALAQRILSKQRRVRCEEPRIVSEELVDPRSADRRVS